jgi:hypothetical protein
MELEELKMYKLPGTNISARLIQSEGKKLRVLQNYFFTLEREITVTTVEGMYYGREDD